MDTFTRISVEKAHDLISTSDVTIVDIRDPNIYAQGHIAKAQQVSDDNIKSFLDTTDRNRPLICYCYHGISSQRAADYFVSQGFRQVYSIDGGYEAWKSMYA